MKNTWIDVDYWAVFSPTDEIIFKGSKTAVKRYAKKHHLIASHVILERNATQ